MTILIAQVPTSVCIESREKVYKIVDRIVSDWIDTDTISYCIELVSCRLSNRNLPFLYRFCFASPLCKVSPSIVVPCFLADIISSGCISLKNRRLFDKSSFPVGRFGICACVVENGCIHLILKAG